MSVGVFFPVRAFFNFLSFLSFLCYERRKKEDRCMSAISMTETNFGDQTGIDFCISFDYIMLAGEIAAIILWHEFRDLCELRAKFNQTVEPHNKQSDTWCFALEIQVGYSAARFLTPVFVCQKRFCIFFRYSSNYKKNKL